MEPRPWSGTIKGLLVVTACIVVLLAAAWAFGADAEMLHGLVRAFLGEE